MEKWKIINEFPKYEVSTYGRVRNIKTKKTLYVKRHTGGYLQVAVQKHNQKKYLYIHRLVADAFLPNPQNLPYVNHMDEDKTNNHVENLEWCTPEYNANYGSCRQRVALSHGRRVRQYTKDGLFIKEWNSYREAERALNIGRGEISRYVKSPYHWVAVDKSKDEYKNI